jgi:hypothetical protein
VGERRSDRECEKGVWVQRHDQKPCRPRWVADAATRMDLARQACAAMATRVAATASHLRRTAHLLERCGTAVKKLRIVRLGFGTW